MKKGIVMGYFIMALIAGFLLWPAVEFFLSPSPYSNVKKISSDWEGDYLSVKYSFVKNEGCELLEFAVVGVGVVNDYLDYKDNGNIPTRQFNREAGEHGLDITIDTRNFNKVEIRTSHLCSGKRVDRVFATEERLHGEI